MVIKIASEQEGVISVINELKVQDSEDSKSSTDDSGEALDDRVLPPRR